MQKQYASALNFTGALHIDLGKNLTKKNIALLFPRVILETPLKFITA
jgi:hypothetical protein